MHASNQNSVIVEHISDKSDIIPRQAEPTKLATPAPQKTPSRSSSFKYYIHDTAERFRLQLSGELTEADVPELNGCWRTAKTTLANRTLLLDLRALKAVDDAGKQWLAWMSTEGAVYQPESYLKTCLAGQAVSPAESAKAARKLSLFGKLLAALRGVRVTAPESSTPAP